MPYELRPADGALFVFGPFRLCPEQRVLFRAETPLRLGSRAKEILFALVERAGETVKKAELIARVWPNVVVEEGALRVHIAALRKALGEGQLNTRYVENVNGHGYRFVAKVHRVRTTGSRIPHVDGAQCPACLHAAHSPVLGREDDLQALPGRLRQRRLVTLVGPGGVGKTALALAAAMRMDAEYSDGIRFVDCGAIKSTGLAAAVAASCGASAGDRAASAPMSRAHNASRLDLTPLKHKRVLIVLDGCEQVIDDAATLAEAILTQTSLVGILATSREPLHALGESLLRVAPLSVPPATPVPNAADAIAFPSIRLFVERATQVCDRFRLTDEEVPLVAEICRRLDGVPLAIELAAWRAGLLGLRALAEQLDDPLNVLTQGRRTATPRHRSLRASLDWSFDLLSETEKTALCRLAAVQGSFDLMTARKLIARGDVPATDVTDLVTALAAKSLLISEAGHCPQARFRLLAVARAHALEKAAAREVTDDLSRACAVPVLRPSVWPAV